MAQLYHQASQQGIWTVLGPPTACAVQLAQPLTITYADGTTQTLPAHTPALTATSATQVDRTGAVWVVYALKGETVPTLHLAKEQDLAGLSADYAPIARVLADRVVPYQLQQGSTLAVDHGGTLVGTRATLNLIDGTGTTLTVADNPAANRVDVTVAGTGGGGAVTTPAARVYRTGVTVPVAAGTVVTVTFTTAEYDQGTAAAQWSLANATRMICQVAGIYQVTAFVGLSTSVAATVGPIEVGLQLTSGVNVILLGNQSVTIPPFGTGYVTVSGQEKLAVGDYVEVIVASDDSTNSALILVGASPSHYPSLAWTKSA